MPLNKCYSLRFPSGRPVNSARKDAKKLARAENIPLYEALNKIAILNGGEIGWEESIKRMASSVQLFRSSKDNLLKVVLQIACDVLSQQHERMGWFYAGGAHQLASQLVDHSGLIYLAAQGDINKALQLLSSDQIDQLDFKSLSEPKRKELVTILSRVNDKPSHPFFKAYLVKVLKNIGAKVTFLSLPPGGGKSTVLSLLLGHKPLPSKNGARVLIYRSHEHEPLSAKLPPSLEKQSCIGRLQWSDDGELMGFSLPAQLKPIVIFKIPNTTPAEKMLGQVSSLLLRLREISHYNNVELIAVDDLLLTATDSDLDINRFQQVVDDFPAFGDRELIIAADCRADRLQVFTNRLSNQHRTFSASLQSDAMVNEVGRSPLFDSAIEILHVPHSSLPAALFSHPLQIVEHSFRLVVNRTTLLPDTGGETAISILELLKEIKKIDGGI